MSWFDDVVGKVRGRAQAEAARYVGQKVKDTARKTVDAVVDQVRGAAEEQLDAGAAELERQDRVQREAAEAREAKRAARAERERKAREDVERLKAEAARESERR